MRMQILRISVWYTTSDDACDPLEARRYKQRASWWSKKKKRNNPPGARRMPRQQSICCSTNKKEISLPQRLLLLPGAGLLGGVVWQSRCSRRNCENKKKMEKNCGRIYTISAHWLACCLRGNVISICAKSNDLLFALKLMKICISLWSSPCERVIFLAEDIYARYLDAKFSTWLARKT